MIKQPTVVKKHSFTGHKDAIYALCALNDYEFLSGGADGHIVKWDLNGYALECSCKSSNIRLFSQL